MNEFDNENRIIERLRSVPTQKVCILNNDDISKKIYESLLLNTSNWKDNSGKTTPPPDFINEKESIMIEVMRVNDTASSANRRESEMQHEIVDSGILDMFPNVKSVSCIPDVHNMSYENYIKSFTSTVEKHNDKTAKYKSNYPRLKRLAFLIFDESEAYFEMHEESRFGFKAREHRWFQDRRFMEQLKKADADAIIWFTPYKVMERDGFDFPDIVVINPKLINDSFLVEYDGTKMVDATRVKRVFPEN